MEINFGTTNSVVAYNYVPNDGSDGITVNHGAHNCFNLYEGNFVTRFKNDGYFGSESDQTFFRNRILGAYYDGSWNASYSIGLRRTSDNRGGKHRTDGGACWLHRDRNWRRLPEQRKPRLHRTRKSVRVGPIGLKYHTQWSDGHRHDRLRTWDEHRRRRVDSRG
jgi:hypothetical protein